MPHQDRLNIAVFIDFDNIEIGVKQTLGQQFDVGIILDAIKERGEVVTKIAYADWTRSGEYSRSLTQHAIRLVQRNMTPGGDKNGADINLALDALEMAFTHSHINAYVIVGGDSDFLSLVEKLKQYDKKVFVVGGRAFTSMILQRNCHEFIAYENLAGVRKAAAKQGRPMPAAAASAPIAQAMPVVRRALKILADREVTPQTGLLKSTLLQLDSTFSERNYGASSFLDFVEKMAKVGYVHLKTSGRSVMVELNEGFVDEPRPAGEGEESTAVAATAAPIESEASGAHAGSSARGARERFPASSAGQRCLRSAEPGTGRSATRRPVGRRRPRRRDPDRGHRGTLADVSAQRETDPPAGRGRIRRAPLCVRRVDGSAEGAAARGIRPHRTRSARRPARVPGSTAAADAESGIRQRAAAGSARRRCRGRSDGRASAEPPAGRSRRSTSSGSTMGRCRRSIRRQSCSVAPVTASRVRARCGQLQRRQPGERPRSRLRKRLRHPSARAERRPQPTTSNQPFARDRGSTDCALRRKRSRGCAPRDSTHRGRGSSVVPDVHQPVCGRSRR